MIIIPEHEHNPVFSYLNFSETQGAILTRGESGLVFVDYIDGVPYLFINKWGIQYKIDIMEIYDEVDSDPEFTD